MKQLLLIRHAKSDWEHPVPDHDRSLNKRGLRNAPFMAKRLAASDVTPTLLVSSTAKRAQHTAQFFAEALGFLPEQIVSDRRIYDAMTSELQTVVAGLPPQHDCVALFGHNPGFTNLSNLLCPKLKLANLPTCGIVALRFNVDSWEKIATGNGELILLDYPKLHTAD